MAGWRRTFPLVAVTALFAICATHAAAEPLNPYDFPSLGASPFTTPGLYVIGTDATPELIPPGGGQSIFGHVSEQTGIAVFTFDTISIGAGVTIRAVGGSPVALLSRGGITIGSDATIDVSSVTDTGDPNLVNGAGGGGQFVIGAGLSGSGGGGGGFRGSGGKGGSINGGAGGVSHGDIVASLQGGSGGGNGPALTGGIGGGAVELGAVGTIVIDGVVTAAGARGRNSSGSGGSGGGSGGAILVHGQSVTLAGTLTTRGGDGGDAASGSTAGGGGGGGAGRIVILTHTGAAGYTPLQTAVVNMNGGVGGLGGSGTFAFGDNGTGGFAPTVGTIGPPAPPVPIAGCVLIHGQPLVSASVKLQLGKGKGSSTSATTNADGCYEFDVTTTGKSGTITIQLPVLP